MDDQPSRVACYRAQIAARMQGALFSHRPRWARMPGWVASGFTDTLLLVLSCLDRLGIEHYAHYGTLLGAVRLGGVAPWDEDADIFVIDRDFDALRAQLGPVLAPHGVELVWTARRDALLARTRPWLAGQGHIGLSLHPGVLRDDEDPKAMTWDAFMRRSELYPLRRYPFGPSYVPGPAQPEPLLARLYGEAASEAVMARHRAPDLDAELTAFWSHARPIEGAIDWPRISARFTARARGLPRHALTFPWWWCNGAYNVGVRKVRAAGTWLAQSARG